MAVNDGTPISPDLLALMDHEKVIEQQLDAASDVLWSLNEIRRRGYEIRRRGLYRARGFATFEDYCRGWWGDRWIRLHPVEFRLSHPARYSDARFGEQAAERVLAYEGWTIVERQYVVQGHRVDLLAVSPDGVETLIEVKMIWEGATTGRDTVLKAIAHAYDLREAGEERPYLLILSHDLRGLYHEMLRRAVEAGAISEVRVLTLVRVDFT